MHCDACYPDGHKDEPPCDEYEHAIAGGAIIPVLFSIAIIIMVVVYFATRG